MLDLIVILVNHNHGTEAQKAVESLYSIPDAARFQLIVVDNASTDGFAVWVKSQFPSTRLLYNTQPHGFAHNINQGLQRGSEARYAMLMNPDIVGLPGLLDRLVSFMDANPDVGIAGPKLLNQDGTIQPSCRRYSTPIGLLIRGLHIDRTLSKTTLMRSYLMDDIDHESIQDVDWITGALMIVRMEAVRKVGLMDAERYFLYSEDQDWCCRMWREGWKVYYVPKAQAIHIHHRAGMRNPLSRVGRYQIISAIKLLHKFDWKLSRVK